jgi:NAD(P)-dependent dehydrogenase (short-subunit alcohol dehydrogenase family)
MRMDEKVVLITGANRGIGFATAQALAQRGAVILMVCRDLVRGIAAKTEIQEGATGPAPTLFISDLSSQVSIRSLADEVASRFSKIDVLINNAGSMFSRRELTIDGLEKTFAINHLAPFLLTNLLLGLLQAAPGGRVITVGSESYSSNLDFDNLQGEGSYNFFGAYMRSKLCNILFTYELARHLKDTNVTANCMSPGPTKTDFGNHMTGLPSLFPKFVKAIPFLLGTPEKGAESIFYLASSGEVEGVSGRFFLRGHERRTKKITYNHAVARQLWTVSEELCRSAVETRYGSGISLSSPDIQSSALNFSVKSLSQ